MQGQQLEESSSSDSVAAQLASQIEQVGVLDSQGSMNRRYRQARNKAIAFMANYDHMNLREIGQRFGLCREAVRQILRSEEVNYKFVLARRRNNNLPSQATDAGARVNTITIIRHGSRMGKRTPEYIVYRDMLDRCFNPKQPGFSNYGGRGITVCDRWVGKFGYENFLLDMGQKPPGVYASGRAKLSIHRIENNGSYIPENCKWATQKEQCANKRPPVRKAHPIVALSLAGVDPAAA